MINGRGRSENALRPVPTGANAACPGG
jgi:hypothetical protein